MLGYGPLSSAPLGAEATTAGVDADLVISYNVIGPVDADLVISYNVLQQVSADLVISYDVLQASADADLVITYSILTGDPLMTYTPSPQRTVTVEPGLKPFTVGAFWTATDPKKPRAPKDPNATLDFSFNWGPWLLDIGDTIVSHTFIVDGGLVDEGSAVAGDVATVFVSGGTLAALAAVTCRISTASVPPRIEDRTVYLNIEER